MIMKNCFLLTISLLLLINPSIEAQENSLFKISQASIQSFANLGSSTFFSANEINVLTNNSHDLPEPILNKMSNQVYHFFGWYSGRDVGLNLNLGLYLRDNETGDYRKNMVLRTGIQFSANSFSSQYGNINNSTRLDTLIAVSNGSQTFVDSVDRSYAYFNKKAEMLNLDFSVIFQTDRDKQWSLFGGVGLTLGASLNSYSEVSYREDKRYVFAENYASSEYSSIVTFFDEDYKKFENRTNLAGLIYVPFGVDLRLGNHNEFWKRIHLFYELRPSLSFYHIPETGTIRSFALSHGMGITVRF